MVPVPTVRRRRMRRLRLAPLQVLLVSPVTASIPPELSTLCQNQPAISVGYSSAQAWQQPCRVLTLGTRLALVAVALRRVVLPRVIATRVAAVVVPALSRPAVTPHSPLILLALLVLVFLALLLVAEPAKACASGRRCAEWTVITHLRRTRSPRPRWAEYRSCTACALTIPWGR